jgi:hypothetical protein
MMVIFQQTRWNYGMLLQQAAADHEYDMIIIMQHRQKMMSVDAYPKNWVSIHSHNTSQVEESVVEHSQSMKT